MRENDGGDSSFIELGLAFRLVLPIDHGLWTMVLHENHQT